MGEGGDRSALSRERIPTVIADTYDDIARRIAGRMAEIIRDRASTGKNAVLGLATGSTPIGIYRELIRLHREDGLDFSRVVTFNLDEYYPMAPDDLHGYRRFMRENLLEHVNIDPRNVHIPRGDLPRDEIEAHGRDYEIKCQLVRAAIACIEAIRSVDPRARFVFAEPIIHVVPPRNRPDLERAAATQDASQWESWDMIAGKVRPELGGDPKYLDIIGVNYYHSNQWELPDVRLPWEDNPLDDRWLPFYKLLDRVYKRYERPIFVAETSHFGIGRPRWIREIAWEVYQARRYGTPIEGICIYPILDRYDWGDSTHWHNSGLWDLMPDEAGSLRRVLNEEYAGALRCSQKMLAEIGCE